MRKVVMFKTALSYALALSLASGTALAAEASRAPAGTVDGAPAVATRLRLIQHTGNARVLLHVARHSPDQACRDAALAAIEEPDALYRLALEGADAALRLAAAERLVFGPCSRRQFWPMTSSRE